MERYQIIDDIGGGGMGRVRLARAAADGRLVVLKTAIHEEDDERLRDEARVGLRIRHEGIVQTVELFEAKDRAGTMRPVLVTGYVPGVTMLELRGRGPLPPVVVCRLGRELALGLAAIHQAKGDDGRLLGIVHRDVTAVNCMVGNDGKARLIDLGIARSLENRAMRTETGLLRGTLRYLAPELFDGGKYSEATDIWSLGVVLWEALLGRAAVLGSDGAAISRITAGLIMVPEDGEQPDPTLTRTLRRLLERDPNKRVAHANEAAALFSMVERSLAPDPLLVTEMIRKLVKGESIAGSDDAVTRVLLEASRVFTASEATAAEASDEECVTDLILRDVASSEHDDASEAKTALQSYAAAMKAMEKADVTWRSERQSLPPLPHTMVQETVDDGATVELRLPKNFPFKPLFDAT